MLHVNSDAAMESLYADLWHQLGKELPAGRGETITDESARELGEVAYRRAKEKFLAHGVSPQDAADEAKLFAMDAVLRLIYRNLDSVLGDAAGPGPA